MQFQRLTKSKDPNFWSVRVGSELRLIVHKTASSLMLCYVGHHDAAYARAERRKIERHPQTGTAQLVEVREISREIVIPKYVEAAPEKPQPKAALRDDDVIPLPERIESVADESDLEELYQTERHLLYVACTRARDHLLVSAAGTGNEFLEDFETQLIPLVST
jgi:hypothetical protein